MEPSPRLNGHAIDGPRFRTPFGFLAVMRRDPLRFLMEATRKHGRQVRIRFTPFVSFLFSAPDDLKHILHDRHRNYWKGVVFGKLKRVAGEGLVFSDGDLWRRQRQLIQPAFHRERIGALAGMMTAASAEMLDGWERIGGDRPTLDVAGAMSRLTLGIVGKALFTTDLGEDEEEFRDTVGEGLVYANHLINHFFTPPLWVPTRANRRGRRAIAAMDRIIWGIIAARRREDRERGDLLSMLIAARDAETHQAMDDRQLRDECITFLVAGHETTAVALSWTFHLLAQHPEVERRLHDEVDQALGGRVPELQDLAELPFTRMVLEESMRLYPPAWATSRQAYEEDLVGGVRVPAGTNVTLSPYVTHRDPELWPDPERFDPERFSPERSAGRHEYAYLPFGAGPRRCVGNQFAMMEGQLVLAMVAQRFRLESVPGRPVEPDPILTLRPRNGLPMVLVRRSRSATYGSRKRTAPVWMS